MYKTLYFKPVFLTESYDNFVNNFISKFKLKTVKQDKLVYFLENDCLLMKLQPEIAEILIYDEQNKDLIGGLKHFFINDNIINHIV